MEGVLLAMLKNLKNSKEARDAMLSLLPTSGTLAGISIGLVGLMSAGPRNSLTTLADDVLLLSALGFLVVCYLIFFAIRNIDSAVATRLMYIIDVVFLSSMTLMVFSGFIITYEFI